MTFSKRTYTAVQRVLRNRTHQFRLNDTWRGIHNELGIGEIIGSQIQLSHDDHQHLRQWCIQETGADPLNEEIQGSRLDSAASVRDEKWATENVFAGMVQVSRATGMIPTFNGDARTPPGTLLSVSVDDLDIDAIHTVVLVENGAIARHWHQVQLPEDLTTALMVYRGHDAQSSVVRQWLQALPPRINKVGYLDFDPAGFGIALDYGLDAIVIPALLKEDLVSGINNKPDAHIKQITQRPELGKQLPASCQPVWSWMLERKCAVTQERLMVTNCPLRILPLKHVD